MLLEHLIRQPDERRHDTPILFIHGAWHGAWCWDEGFMQHFNDLGYECHAISLRGHGGSDGREKLRWTSLRNYVDDIAHTVEEIDRPPILVGHSMGGGVVQKYLERHHDIPAAVLMGSMPPAGVLATTLRIMLRYPIRFLRMNLTLSLLPLVESQKMVQEMFYSESLPKEKLQAYTDNLQDESYRAFLDMMIFSLPKPAKVKTPVLVLGGGKDSIFLPGQMHDMAKAYHTQPVMFPNMAHNLMLEEGWEEVATGMLNWLRQQGL